MALTNAQRAAYGLTAIEVGTPDHGKNGDDFTGLFTDAGDTIANILHTLCQHPDADEMSLAAVWDTAWMHFDAEVQDEQGGGIVLSAIEED